MGPVPAGEFRRTGLGENVDMNVDDEFSAARFYAERDKRTCEYVGHSLAGNMPINVHADVDICTSPAGQLVLSTLANLLVRAHRTVTFCLANPDAPLIIHSLVAGTTIGTELDGIMQRADPFGRFVVDHRSAATGGLRFQCGTPDNLGLQWFLGVDRACAILDNQPAYVGSGAKADARGAILAAVLGAATAFKESLGFPSKPKVLSAWNLATGSTADPGPTDLQPIQVGRVLVAGAGAVTSGLAYCMLHWGAEGTWILVDKDLVKVHNTNRSLLFFPDHAGWAGGVAKKKVDCLIDYFPNCVPDAHWYDESAYSSESFDTVLALANERDVRTLLARRNDPIQLHATTGRSWLSQLHRHVAGSDDCLRCRMADIRMPTFGCSNGDVSTPSTPNTSDAALPFLSVASGLMLASALQRLGDSAFWNGPHNTWRWDFRDEHSMYSAGWHSCRENCDVVLSPNAQQLIAGQTIWADIGPLNSQRRDRRRIR